MAGGNGLAIGLMIIGFIVLFLVPLDFSDQLVLKAGRISGLIIISLNISLAWVVET